MANSRALFFLAIAILLVFPHTLMGVVTMDSTIPNCINKCGRCKPCVAVVKRVPPMKFGTDDYFPVIWRCSCGGVLHHPAP
ncbi:hypothetical protein M569_09493 [Genlisea aurea]|uniref:Epidermal patterning factor-like protein n=1 Tax=Genlisea aurea TaxID=192259 RepID=S8CKR6_9LAMI|nr:hypothetical protein M569_09493 [Genlisea aurea]